jgi:hypothetical protein
LDIKDFDKALLSEAEGLSPNGKESLSALLDWRWSAQGLSRRQQAWAERCREVLHPLLSAAGIVF